VYQTPPPTVPPASSQAASAARSFSFHDLGCCSLKKKAFDTTALDVLKQKKTSPLGAREGAHVIILE